jgi:hypothetical protein
VGGEGSRLAHYPRIITEIVTKRPAFEKRASERLLNSFYGGKKKTASKRAERERTPMFS